MTNLMTSLIVVKLFFLFLLMTFLWFFWVCFIKLFTLDSETIIPNQKFWTTPVVLGGLVVLCLYMMQFFLIIWRLT